jgi:hypothetical protein
VVQGVVDHQRKFNEIGDAAAASSDWLSSSLFAQ